jgi:hypothetical protein
MPGGGERTWCRGSEVVLPASGARVAPRGVVVGADTAAVSAPSPPCDRPGAGVPQGHRAWTPDPGEEPPFRDISGQDISGQTVQVSGFGGTAGVGAAGLAPRRAGVSRGYWDTSPCTSRDRHDGHVAARPRARWLVGDQRDELHSMPPHQLSILCVGRGDGLLRGLLARRLPCITQKHSDSSVGVSQVSETDERGFIRSRPRDIGRRHCISCGSVVTVPRAVLSSLPPPLHYGGRRATFCI